MTDFWGDHRCPGDHHPEDCPLAAEFDRRGQAETHLRAENERLRTRDQTVRRILNSNGDDAADELVALRAALTELIHASRGLAFFDQIKCDRWNTAYTQAREVAGLEEEQ
jgi:hypothetical protein